MAIREATTSVQEPTPTGPRPDRRRRRRDLRAGPIPAAALEQWQDTETALTQLYRYAEARAIDAIDWYLADKRSKRIWSRGLRLLVILLVTAGGLQPLLDAAAPGPSRTAWGYVLLALAAACIGLDRFFGISSGWMRSMTTAQALERRLEQLQYDWAAECARSAARTVDPQAGPDPPGPAAGRLRQHGRPHAAGDGRVGAGVPEQPAAPGDLDRRLLELDPRPLRPGREGEGPRAPAGEGSPAQPATPAGR